MPSDHLPLLFRRLFIVRVLLLAVALGANLLLLGHLLDLDDSLIIFAAGTTLYAIVTTVWWRCPHCGRYPGNSVMPDLCERCGAELFGHDRPVAPPASGGIHNPDRTITHLLVVRILYGAALIALFAIWAPRMQHDPAFFWGASLAVMAVGAWGEWRWWRCPHCGGYLKRTIWPGRTCGKCGGKLV